MADDELLRLLPLAGGEQVDDDDDVATLELLSLISSDDSNSVRDRAIGTNSGVDMVDVPHDLVASALAHSSLDDLLFDDASDLLLDLDLLDGDLSGATDDAAIPNVGAQSTPHFSPSETRDQVSESPDRTSADGDSDTVVMEKSERLSKKVVRPAATQDDSSPVKGKRTRLRVKDELEYLRQQVQELEQQLRRLQHPQQASEEQESASGAAIADSSSTPSLSRVWEQIAQHQKGEKHKIEVENVKLREMLEGQLKVASSLARILRKRPDVSWLESSESSAESKKRLRVADANESDTYDLLAEQVDALYDQLGAVFADTGFDDSRVHEIRDAQVKTDANDNMYMELVDSKILPFDLAATSAAVWNFLGLSHTKFHNGVYRAIESTDDTVRSTFTVTLRLRRGEALVHVNLLLKKFVEGDRVVILWRSMGVSEGSLLGARRIRISESGWTIIRELNPSPTTSPPSDSSPRSIIQSVIRAAPEIQHSVEGQQHAGVLTDLIIGSYHQNIKVIFQQIENLLMAEAMG